MKTHACTVLGENGGVHLSRCLDASTVGFDCSLRDFLDGCASSGFDAVEWPIEWVQAMIKTTSVVEVKKLFASFHLQPAQFTGSFGAPANLAVAPQAFERRLAAFRDNCALASTIGCTRASIAIDTRRHGGIPLGTEEIVLRIRRVAAVAIDYHVRLSLDIVDRALLYTIDPILACLQAVSPYVGLLVDFFGLYRCGLGAEWISALPCAAIAWLRLSDAPQNKERSQLRGADRLLPGTGGIDLHGLLNACLQKGYCGTVSLECYDPVLRALSPQQRAKVAFEAIKEYVQ